MTKAEHILELTAKENHFNIHALSPFARRIILEAMDSYGEHEANKLLIETNKKLLSEITKCRDINKKIMELLKGNISL